MSAERATYLDASAIVKLAVAEPESDALRRYLRRRPTLVSSALSRM
jgi:predicted nucleic acid-binding protein